MPTELEELVGFIAHPNPQIRKTALENLVSYSTAEPSIFRAKESTPIKNLRLLVRDHPTISEHAITILVNLSTEQDVAEMLAKDEKFLELVFSDIVKPDQPNANILAMLLANIVKSDSLKSIITRTQPCPESLGSDDSVMNQLMDLFVKGQSGGYNKDADLDYLAYVLADLAKHAEIRQYFTTVQSYDGQVPLSKVRVFTEHKSPIRRQGVASTIKNVAFEVPSHKELISVAGVNLLPYVLLPIMGSEEYDMEESMDMLPELQLLPPDKARESDPDIVRTHVETLMLLTTTRESREYLREIKVYPIIRETHMRVEDEGVQEACDRLVQVLMRDEEPEEDGVMVEEMVDENEDEDEDDEIREV